MTNRSTPPHAAELPEPSQERLRRILEIAAKEICDRGFDGASIQRIADACGLTKGGLYHHIRSKEHLLLEIMHYGMDLFEERVLLQVMPIADPVERLRETMRRNVLLVTRDTRREVTIILHEHATLRGEAQAQINARKKRYVRFLESTITEATRNGDFRDVDPKVAAFSILGMVLWTYKWFRADGAVKAQELAEEMIELVFQGLVVSTQDLTKGIAE